MVLLSLGVGVAAAADVLLVQTPGVPLEAHLPLRRGLEDAGHAVTVLGFPCSGDAGDMARQVAAAAEAMDTPVLVAHGLGATAALSGAAHASVSRYVLLAPVLGVPELSAVAALAAREVSTPVTLGAPAPFGDRGLHDVLLGEERPELGCISPAFALEVQGWIEAGVVPVPPDTGGVPLWVGVGLLDDVAPPEVVVPAARGLGAHIHRLGITGLHPEDYGHAEMLVDAVPIRAAVKAVDP